MTKFSLLFSLLFISFISQAQLLEINHINNNTEANYSLQELIENVLITGACAQVDTFSEQVNGNSTDTQTKSYGYFKRPVGNSFPFEEGIVLSTGRAYPSGNNTTASNISFSNGLSGDVDLATALSQNSLSDATFIKFTFVPTSNSITFRYLMASEEYDGTFECNYADSFAFLLREEGTTAYTNLAVLPDSTPVSVRNINDANGCRSNTAYFEGYNVGNTNFGGRTKALLATAVVIPNQRYEIKLVVADQTDSDYDSAIFLEAGSFVLGASLGDPKIAATNNAACGNEVLLDANIVATSYKWYKDNVEIIGETNQTYLANLGDGTYKVEVELGVGCIGEDEIEVEFVTAPTINPVISKFYECDNDNNGTSIFNLTNKDTEILNGQSNTDFIVKYYLDNTYTLFVPNPTAHESSGQTIYARVLNTHSNNCVADSSFEIEITTAIAALPADIPKLADCDNTSVGTVFDGINLFNLEDNKNSILNGSSNSNFTLTYFTDAAYTNQIPTTDVTNYSNTSSLQTIYVQMTNNLNTNCFDRTSFEIEVYPNPQLNTITIKQCDDDTDGFSDIDLTLANSSISANFATETFSYYETEALANSATTPISSTNYNTNTKTIWVRVENAHCFSVAQVNIIVSATSTTYNTTISKCDDYLDAVNDDYDGVTAFDLTQVENDVLNQFPIAIQPNLNISYYQNITDAQLQNNPIINPATYRNTTSPTQRIFIRVNNNSNLDCAGLGANLYVDLVVETVPTVTQPITKRNCDIGNDQANFDTTGIINEVLNGQTGITLRFYDENNVFIPTANFFPTYLTGSQTIRIVATNDTTNDINGACNKETTLEFIVDTIPVANPVAVQQLCDDRPDPTDGMSLFDTSSIESTILGGTTTQPNTKVHYYTNYYDAALKAEILPTLPEFFNTATQIVTAEVINLDNPNCVAITDIQFLIATDAPVFEISDQLLCLDQLPTPLIVSIENPLDNYEYAWFNDNNEQIGTNADSVEITEAGEYTIVATTTTTICETTKTFIVTESSIPKIETITIFDDIHNNRVSVLVSGAGEYEFAIDDGNFIDGNEIYGHIFHDVEEGAHLIHINDKNGCTPIVTKEVIVIRFPRFITPNHDGINDTFYVYGGNAFSKSKITILDRYGKVLANLGNNTPWDGIYKDVIAPESDYWFLATFTDHDGKIYERKGHFSLKR